ncbi:hypothetical protein FIBSPDRAFT_857450 [Athelia psychrophila]|uniref:Uncharacterized protein n=1 Tax=Athelia psychrophila TaxID=1759441 RepID=A0A166MUC0_9AGAM|nr:hypothetical protein FIBSPDRAFT_857450 [Fibularhizoctonia sp. CBS 109695]
MLLAPVVLVGGVMSACEWAGQLLADLEARHIQLQATLRTLHITDPFLVSPILPPRPAPSPDLECEWGQHKRQG